ncbi:alpha/beta-hydrolase [Plenodomus tracheiphilus IPT5]|uniref:Alpha/beta-hydrolase n=1 Tax=Plenodomus tracheiphilus IPT5 TaxID=1408161 RepID=A0A6A7B4F9_9PLEO|nr:alpha/beta-hydrolase [Plenodomus tracheiphilus IPT5]
MDDTTPATRFDSFNVYRTFYKTVGTHAIEVGLLVPKTLKPGKHPLLVKFHGGGLVTGDCLYPDWHSAFFVPFIHRTNCITVLPNYRLVPEHSGADILSDLDDFWTWFHSDKLSSFLKSQGVVANLDYDHVLVSGDSAGGYMTLMSGLTQPKGSIKALLAQYPMTDSLRRDPTAELYGQPTPPPTVVDKYTAGIKPGTVISSAVPPARMDISYALSAYGRYLEFFGSDKSMWPLYLVETKDYLPPTWIVHGDADTAVSIEDSRAFVNKARKLGGAEVELVVRPGEEHGFDAAVKEVEEEWLKEGLRWVEDKWLG